MLHTVKVLGKNCGTCLWTERLVREVVAELGAEVLVEKVTKRSELAQYRVSLLPAVVVDGLVVHTGGIPTKAEVQRWIQGLQP